MEKSKVIEKLFFDIVTYSYLLLPFSFLFLKRQYRGIMPITIAIYCIVCFFFLFFIKDFPRHLIKYFLSGYTFFEYAIFTFIFCKNFTDKKIRSGIILISIVFLIFQSVYVISGRVQRLDSVPIGIETILILSYIIYFFYQFSKNVEGTYIFNHYLFWISVGILIYLGGSFFFFILINHLTSEQVTTFGIFTYVAEIIKNILFMVGIYIYARNQGYAKGKKQNSVPYLDMI